MSKQGSPNLLLRVHGNHGMYPTDTGGRQQATGAGAMRDVPVQTPPTRGGGHGYHRCSAPPLPSEPSCPLAPPQSPAGGPTGWGGADPLPRACVTILRFSKTKSLFSRKANTGLRLRAAFFQQLAPDFCLELQAQRACLGCRQTRLIIFLGK